MPISSTTRRISSREWANRKPRILELYSNDERTLAEVIEEMTREGFTATKSQYEHQFRVWGVRKNMKRSEWAKAIREWEQGGSTAPIILSGRALPGSKVETARRRYGPKRPQVSEEPALRDNDDVAQAHAALPIVIEDIHMPTEELASGATMPAAGYHNEAIDMSIYAGTNEVNLDQFIQLPGETSNMRSHETPVEFDFQMYNTDLINSINFDLPAQETCLPSTNDLLYAFETQQAQGMFLEEPYIPTTGMTSNFSPPIVVSPNSLHIHRQTLPKNQWSSSPSADIVAKIIKDAYFNISPTFTGRAMLNPNSGLVWQFLACMNGEHSASVAMTKTLPPSLKRLFPTQAFAGEEPDQLALLPSDVAPEARLYAKLIASVINGFAGLEGMPPAGVLRFLNRHTTIQLLMIEFMCSNPGPVARSLAENIFQAALEADDVDVIKYLLDHTELIDANEAVCIYHGKICTPLEKAAMCQSFRAIKLLISRKVDTNKSFSRDATRNALERLIMTHIVRDEKLTLDNDFLGIVDTFLEANATISVDLIEKVAMRYTDPRLVTRLVEQIVSQGSHEPKLDRDNLLKTVVDYLEERVVISLIGLVIEKHRGSDDDLCLHKCVNKAVERGYQEVVRRLLPYAKYPDQVLLWATRNGNHAIVDLILQAYPRLTKEIDYIDAMIAALKSRNQNHLRLLEERGSLDCFQRSEKLGEALIAALEAGNLECSTKILNLDPELGFILYGEFDTITGLGAALANNFDDIAWDILAARITQFTIFSWPRLLQVAIAKRKPDFVKAIIEYRPYHHITDHFYSEVGFTPDHVRGDYSSVMEAAIKCGDDSILNDTLQVHPPDFSPTPALLKLALEKGYPGLLYNIIEAGSLQERKWKRLAAEYAIEWENIPMLDKLIDVGAELDDALLYKAVMTNPSMVGPLLERYWNIYPQGLARYGWLTINYAVTRYSRSPELLEMLFASKLVTVDILQGDGMHDTPLTVATKQCMHYRNQARNPFRSLIERLLDAGSNVNSTSFNKGSKTTPFLEAIEAEDTELVRLFIHHGAEIDKPARFGIRQTPLQKAVQLNNLEIVHLLLDKGADPNAPPAILSGATALQWAAIQGNCEIARVLIERGAKLDTPPLRGRFGRWPLEGAAEHGRVDMIKLLWEVNGGPFDNKQCEKAIRLAEWNGHLGCRDFIKKLMATGSSNGGQSLTY